MRNVEVTFLQERLHSLLKDLNRVTSLDFDKIQLRSLLLTEPLKLLLSVLDIQAAKFCMGDLPLFKLSCGNVL